MFGKIRDKLRDVFKKSEEVIDEDDSEEILEEPQLPENTDDLLQKEVKKEKYKPAKQEFDVASRKFVPVIDEEDKQDSIEKKSIKTKKKLTKKELKISEQEISEKQSEKESLETQPSKEDILDSDSSENQIEEEPKEEKKGFFSRVFGKKQSEIEEEQINSETISKTIEENPITQDMEEKEQTLSNENQGFISKTFTKLKSKKIDETDFDKIWLELEIFLLEINIAYEIVSKIETKLKEELIGHSFNRFKLSEKIKEVLQKEVEEVLKDREKDFYEEINKYKQKEEILKILVLGVNGTGKTTTIAKLVHHLKKNNFSTVVAAADTFRAAAIEQLEEHSKKVGFKLIMHKNGSDPAAVAYDAIEHAKAKNLDIVLIDTAGRMPNNSNLMMELQKIKRVSQSQMAIFIGDSISGNDLIDQIELFDKGVNIDGAILTKVDTDERPGSIVTTAYSIEKPIYFLGYGQTYEDLIKFDAKTIAQKLFDIEEDNENNEN